MGVFSQSGALGVTLLNELAGRNNQGWISKFISFGNACDVNEMDIMKYYSEEPSVKQVVLRLSLHPSPGPILRASATALPS